EHRGDIAGGHRTPLEIERVQDATAHRMRERGEHRLVCIFVSRARRLLRHGATFSQCAKRCPALFSVSANYAGGQNFAVYATAAPPDSACTDTAERPVSARYVPCAAGMCDSAAFSQADTSKARRRRNRGSRTWKGGLSALSPSPSPGSWSSR